MNTAKRRLISALLICLLLLLSPVTGFASVNGPDNDVFDGLPGNAEPQYQDLKDQITSVQRPIAVDNDAHYIDIQVSLKYKINEALNRNPFRYFTITPVFDDTNRNLFEFDKSNYTQYIKDLVVITDENDNYVEDYFSFPFWVRDDAVNGNYILNFEVKFLNFYADIDNEQPTAATVPVYFRIEHGKEAPKTDEGGNGGTGGEPEKNPSTAMLLLESYSIDPTDVGAGEEFDLSLTFRNTTDKALKDVKAVLSDELNTLLPASGSSTIYIDRIAGGETAQATVRMRSTANCGIEPAVLKIAYDYVQSDMAYTGGDSITLPVRQMPNLSLDTPYYASEMFQGDSTNITMNLFNKGRSTVYNVTVFLECEGLRADETYFAGNMDSGISRTYDVMASAEDGFSGQASGNIVVTYEDEYGVESRKEVPITLNVVSMDYGEDDLPVMDDMPDITEPVQSGIPFWVWIAIGGGVALVVLVVVIVLVKRRRRRRKAEDVDDEMD